MLLYDAMAIAGSVLMYLGIRRLGRHLAVVRVRREAQALAAQARVNVPKTGTWPGRYMGRRR